MEHTITDPEAYINAIIERLTRAGATVASHYTQQDAGRTDNGELIWEAFIGFEFYTDDPDEKPDEIGFAWNELDGWQRLAGPRTDFGPFNNVADMDLNIDAPVDEIAAAILTELGVDDPAGTGPLPL